MKVILIDAGNTTIDCRFFQQQTKKIKKGLRVLTNDFLAMTPRDFLDKLAITTPEPVFLAYSSVVPNFNQWLTDLPRWVNVFNIRDSSLINNKDFDFDWERLGSDFLAMFYAREWTNAVLINCGTASTISFISQGKFQGTIITPGVTIGLEALINKAALLTPGAYKWETALFGQNTQVSLGIGCVNGHYEMLKSLATKQMTIKSEIVFTGGNAILFQPGWTQDGFEYQEDLIFAGLIYLSQSALKIANNKIKN
ncbi:type III pantothenate kinase [Entomoplasma freundtii]|uniref:Type III pantothenate kinase n=1 Tax=Entomoplasma freundtii TaxID=74700 RepID=A0A2K8NST7_9MOLU|nr:type III pantothenate kinase [Entomoplasma freundtii]ATZ16228.1 type III pantothenate kinase [Entomoplasma freundtii]TDY56871.1 type III pantothenate kinase [Entomoplasma freundtii]